MDGITGIARNGHKDGVSIIIRPGDVNEVGEIEAAITLSNPAAVETVEITAVCSEERDRAHELGRERIKNRSDLNDLVRAAAEVDVELRLARLSHSRLRVAPVAENARAVAAQIHTREWHATLPHDLGGRAEQEFVVEDLAHTLAERGGASWVAGGIQNVVHLDGAA